MTMRQTMVAACCASCLLSGNAFSGAIKRNDDKVSSQAKTDLDDSFALELDGRFVGFVSGVEGGAPTYNLVTAPTVGPDGTVSGTHQTVAGQRWGDVTFRAGTGMSPRFYAWIAEFLAGKSGPHDLALHGQKERGVGHQDGNNLMPRALTTQVSVGLPSGASDATMFVVRVAPQLVQTVDEPLYVPPVFPPPAPRLQAEDVHLRFAGAHASDPINAVEVGALTARRSVSAGDLKGTERAINGNVNTDSLVSVLSPELLESITSPKGTGWWDGFATDPNKLDTRTLAVDFLADDGFAVFTLTLQGVGFVSLGTDFLSPAGEGLLDRSTRRITVELYIESMTLEYNRAKTQDKQFSKEDEYVRG